MKVLHVISGMNPEAGGVCQAVRGIIAGLDSLGFSNEVVSLDDPESNFLGTDGFRIHACGPGQGAWCWNPALTSWLKNNISRFDAVIIHGLWQYHSYAAWRAVKVANGNAKDYPIQLFVMTHGMLDPWFQKISVRPFKAVRNWLFWKLVEKRVVNDADGLIFTCEQERLLAHLTFRPYKPQSEHVVGLGVETPPTYNDLMRKAFQCLSPDLAGRKYLLFLSRIHPKKGVDLLIRAYSEAQRMTAPDSRPCLVIAGPGLDTPYGQDMQKLAEQLCPANSIHFPGMLTGDAKWGAFYGCDAFILPSHQENFGIAVVEALACGKPVLISNQVNIWREIEAMGAGIVKTDSLAGTLDGLNNWALKNDAERKSMATSARHCYQSHFQTDQFAVLLYDVFRRACEKKLSPHE